MKIGDKIPVTIAGQVVCDATVKGMEEGTATLVVPATLVVMATRTELTVEQREPEGNEVLITGVDRVTPEATENPETGPVTEVENNVSTDAVANDAPAESNTAAPTDAVETVEVSDSGTE